MRHNFARVFTAVMLLGWALIAYASLEYFDSENVASFVLEKLPVRFEKLWLNALTIHVATAIVTFPACLALATRWLQKKRTWHRWIGRGTGSLVLFSLVPSGVVLAFEAKGGTLGTLGFLLSGAIVAFAILFGVGAARRGDLIRHGYFMGHVIAQMSVAVTSRALLILFSIGGLDPEVAYLVALWVPVLGSVAFVEMSAERSKRSGTTSALTLSRSLS